MTKNGIGTLTLSGQNTFSGGSVLSGGVLNVNSNSALGTGVFSVSGGRLGSTNNFVVIPNPTNFQGDFQVSPPDNAAAQLEFAGPLTTSGATIRAASAGTVRFSNSIAGDSPLSLRTNEGGVNATFIMSGDVSNTYNVINRSHPTTTVGFPGAVNRTLLVLAKTGGATAIQGGLLIEAFGTVRLAQSDQIADDAGVVVGFNGTLDLDGYNEKLSFITGQNIQLDGPSRAGTLTVDEGDISGLISDGGLGGNLTKLSTGIFALKNRNTYSGTTLVSAGELDVSNNTGSATGSGPVIVEGGASLTGGNPTGTAGFIGGKVLIKDLAILAPGIVPATAGLLTFNSDLTLSQDSKIRMQLRTPSVFTSPNNDRTKVVGQLVLDGIIEFDTTQGFGGYGEYLLFSYGTLIDNGLEIGPTPLSGIYSIDLSHPGQVILHVVPEATTSSMILLISACLLRSRHRRAAS